MLNLDEKLRKQFKIILLFLYLCILTFTFLMIEYKNYEVMWNSFKFDFLIYVFIIFVLLIILNIFAFKKLKKTKSNNYNKSYIILCCLVSVFIVIIVAVSAMHKTTDYTCYLNIWSSYYKNVSIKDALYSIVDVSNYTPVYNYFLIFISKIKLYNLFSIKLLTFGFSILFAFVLEKLINYFKKDNFNYFRFLLIFTLPPVFMEFFAWGQCDVIYTSFAMLAFLFALKKKSKLSFMFVGLSFAFKLQFLFVVPILFVMLIVKDETGKHYLLWKDIWIAPLMYAVNLVPLFAGRPIDDLLMVYLVQTFYDERLSGNCGNICLIFQDIFGNNNALIFQIIMLAQIFITFVLIYLILLIILKLKNQDKLKTIDLVSFGFIFSFVMVMFMPKMLDRFYFIAYAFSLILCFCNTDKLDRLISIIFNVSFSFVIFNGCVTCVPKFVYFSLLLNIVVLVLIIFKIKKQYLSVNQNILKK